MNYSKLVSKLRQKAYDYDGEKDVQFSRILKEAIQRKIKQHEQTNEYKTRYATKQERLLFVTR